MTDLRGIWGFPLTPFADGGRRSRRSRCRDRAPASGGIDVLCACGLIAEVESLSRDEWHACAAATLALAGDVPGVVAIPAADDGWIP